MTSSLDFIMAIVVCLLAVYDSSVTQRRIQKYGLDVELNPTIHWLTPRVGLDVAIALGIMIPTLAIASVLAKMDWTTPLAMWLGAKLITARYQMISTRLEAEMDEQLRSRSTEMAASSLPPEDSRPGAPK